MIHLVGIDPGTNLTGYACVAFEPNGTDPVLVEAGVIRLPQSTPLGGRLVQLAEDLEAVFNQFKPQKVVVESIFAEVPIKSPTFIRMAMVMYSLNTPADRKRSGNYWSRSVVAISKVYPRLNLEEDSGLHAIPPDMTAFEGFAFKGRTYYRCSPDSKPVPCFQNPVSRENMVFTFNDVNWNE